MVGCGIGCGEGLGASTGGGSKRGWPHPLNLLTGEEGGGSRPFGHCPHLSYLLNKEGLLMCVLFGVVKVHGQVKVIG